MRHHVAMLAPALLVGGCSLIYNPSNIDKPRPDASDAQGVDMEMVVDAAIDAPPLADSNPAALMLEKVGPATIYEGQGVGGSRQALVVIRGHHISPSATVAITPTTDLTQGTPVFSMNGDFVLVPVTIAISAGMDTELVDLTVAVDQAGATQQVLAGQLKLQYLPEFPSGTSIDAGTLAELYSSVATNDVTFTGTVPAIVRSVSSISIGNINVAGADAVTDTLGTAGPGGCEGGAPGQAGGCSGFPGGGLGASMSNGGGGGGFGTAGGGGAGGATGGAVHGNPQVVNYVAGANSNRSGGGGGGQGVGFGTGGAGGGGGGTIELTAGGNITTGTITANGGKGGNGSGGVTNLTDASGGGGGGSGGVIVVRSVAGMISAGAITAVGGAAGAPKFGGGGGGAGGEGRVRIDSPAANPPATTPTAHRGPTFATTTPTSVTVVRPTLTVNGATGDKIDGYVIDMDGLLRSNEPVNQELVSGTVDVMTTLIPGYNKLCFTLQPALRPTTPMNPVPDPLADSCIDIAYLP